MIRSLGSLSCLLYPIHATSASYSSSSISWINAANHVFSDSKKASHTLSQWSFFTRITYELCKNLSLFYCIIKLSFKASQRRSISSTLYCLEDYSNVLVPTALIDPYIPKKFLPKSSSSCFFCSRTFSSCINLRRCSSTLFYCSLISFRYFSSAAFFSGSSTSPDPSSSSWLYYLFLSVCRSLYC